MFGWIWGAAEINHKQHQSTREQKKNTIGHQNYGSMACVCVCVCPQWTMWKMHKCLFKAALWQSYWFLCHSVVRLAPTLPPFLWNDIQLFVVFFSYRVFIKFKAWVHNCIIDMHFFFFHYHLTFFSCSRRQPAYHFQISNSQFSTWHISIFIIILANFFSHQMWFFCSVHQKKNFEKWTGFHWTFRTWK